MELTKEDAIKQLTKEDAIKRLKIVDDNIKILESKYNEEIKILESKYNEEINKLELKLIRLNDEEEKLILKYDSSWK